jgi:hypothetical protein
MIRSCPWHSPIWTVSILSNAVPKGITPLIGPFLVIASAGSGDIGTLVQLAYLRSATLATDLTVAFPDAKGTRMN